MDTEEYKGKWRHRYQLRESQFLCGEPEFNIGAKCAFSFLKNKQLETHLCETYNHNYLSGKKVH